MVILTLRMGMYVGWRGVSRDWSDGDEERSDGLTSSTIKLHY